MTDEARETPIVDDRAPTRANTRRRPRTIVTQTIRQLLLTILVGGCGGFMLGFAHYLLVPPEYFASAIMYVSPVDTGTRSATNHPVDNLGQVRWTQALARIALDPAVSRAALEAVGLDRMAADPLKYVTTSAAPDTSVFSVTVHAPDAPDAAAGVKAVAKATSVLAESRSLPVRAATLGEIPVPSHAAPTLALRLVIGAAMGAFLGLLWMLSSLDKREVLTPTRAA